MKIIISYDSCWQTGFLAGNHNLPVSKKDNPRKFIATSKTRGEKPTPITDDTVMGVLSRLIGDQRRLYQRRLDSNYFFKDIEAKTSWRLLEDQMTEELVYLTNKSDDRCAQSIWMGVIPDDCPWFSSDIAPLFWSVLYLDRKGLMDFILSEQPIIKTDIPNNNILPKPLLARVENISDSKSEHGRPWKSEEQIIHEKNKLSKSIAEENEKAELQEKEADSATTEKKRQACLKKIAAIQKKTQKLIDALSDLENDSDRTQEIVPVTDFLSVKHKDNDYWRGGLLYPMSLYAAALYLQAERLIESGYNLEFALNKNNEVAIKGFSRAGGFNGAREWLNPMAGGRKKAVGTPCRIQKHSGQLEINLEIDLDMAVELKTMIDNAGVSAFYLGKKGLAYVSHIDVR